MNTTSTAAPRLLRLHEVADRLAISTSMEAHRARPPHFGAHRPCCPSAAGRPRGVPRECGAGAVGRGDGRARRHGPAPRAERRRAPAFGPRAGIPHESALAWRPVPLNRQPFLITHLDGALGPGDLVVFANLCDRYWRERADGGRVVVSLNEVARWLGQERPGGSQRRQAVGSLVRLRAATFTSVLRAKGRDTERLVRGWGLVDEWLLSEHGTQRGTVRLSAAVVEMLDAGSVVLLDGPTLKRLLDRDPLAARLWVFLEADTFEDGARDDVPDRSITVFAARRGEDARERDRAAIADLCRLSDQDRSKTVAILRRVCRVIEEEDTRYRLRIDSAARRRAGMWNLLVRRWRHTPRSGMDLLLASDLSATHAVSPAPARGAGWGSQAGRLGDGKGASWESVSGILRDGAGQPKHASAAIPTLADGAGWGMDASTPRRVSSDGLPDESLQTVPALERRIDAPMTEQRHVADREAVVERDIRLLRDPSTSQEIRLAARDHLAFLGVADVEDGA